MVRRDAAGDQIEAVILEWQRFRLGVSGAQVGQPALVRLGFDHIEHFLSDVGGPDAIDMRGEEVGDMAAAGGDVEHAPVFLRGGEGDQTLKALAERMRL